MILNLTFSKLHLKHCLWHHSAYIIRQCGILGPPDFEYYHTVTWRIKIQELQGYIITHETVLFIAGNKGHQPFSCGHHLVLQVHKSDIMHPIMHKALRTTQSLVVGKCSNLSNNASQPPSCGYSDVTLTTSISKD